MSIWNDWFFLQYTTYTCEKNMNIYLTECIYNEWSEWTECSKPCDNGAQFRNRTLHHYIKNIHLFLVNVLTRNYAQVNVTVVSLRQHLCTYIVNILQSSISELCTIITMMGMKENTCLTLEHNKWTTNQQPVCSNSNIIYFF
jgi:hypothetical protein